ncbi:MAG: phage portal protein [Clostridia bacterium]|nr:phage portal protein [Clostridia bacterium]
MTIREKIRYLLTPERGKRELLRAYDAAVKDRLHGGWRAVNDAAENEQFGVRDTLRARARDLERNSDIINAALSAFERNVVSTGIVLQPSVMSADGTTEEEALNRAIEAAWWEWQNRCDVTGCFSFEDIQRMALRRRIVDGGLLIVKCYDRKNGFRLQIREVDELDSAVAAAGNSVFGGIEVDKTGRILRYHLSGYTYDSSYVGRSEESLPAERVIYIRHRSRPSQVREITPLASAMSIIAHLNSYIEAVTVKERMLACFGIAITKMEGGGALGRVSGEGSKKDRHLNIKPGMVMELQPGEKVEPINPQNGVGANMTEFVKIQTRLFAASLGLSYESLSRDMSGVSYSSARQALLDDQRTFKVLQDYLICELCTPVYEAWLEYAVLEGKVPIKAADFFANRRKYTAHTWTPVGWEWVDPLKDITASVKAIDANMTTLQAVCAESGKDWRDVIRQRKIENDFIASVLPAQKEEENKNA